MSDETLVYYGDTVKALGDGRVGGYLVRFGAAGDTDLEGDYFAAATDFGVDAWPAKSAVYYNHGYDPVLKRRRLAVGEMHADSVGVWVEAQLSMRDGYEKAIYELAQAGKLGWSSGTAAHLVEKEAKGAIVRWPLGLDASLTPTPAEYRNAAIPLKSWLERNASETLLPEMGAGHPIVQSVDADPTSQATAIEIVSQETTMSDELKTPAEAPAQTLEVNELGMMRGQINDLTKSMNSILQYIQDTPSIRKSGYYTEDGGKADTRVKSFADWLLSVQRNDTTRLKSVYGSAKAMGEESGTAGGFLVPEEFERRLLEVATPMSIVRSRATIIPVTTHSGQIPALDQVTVPTAGVGNTAFAGGVVAAWAEEAATLGETNAAFKMLEWQVNKLGGYTKVSNELLADSAIAIETLLVTLFGRAIAAMEDYAFLRGDGAGKPLGILNAPCTIAVSTASDNVFKLADALNMLAQFWAYAGRTVWIMHPGLIPDFADSSFGTTGNAMPLLAPRDSVGGLSQLSQPLLGYPVLFSEHMPNPNTDDAILADLSAYLIFDRAGTAISFSEHAAFLTDQGTWRFTKRLDGKPWLMDQITLASPTGYEVSPFLYHND